MESKEYIDRMFSKDMASQGLGMKVTSLEGNAATVTMEVRSDMLNGHGNCHGGFIFSVADSAFAFASNACMKETVAAQCSITYLRPAKKGDLLTATAIEVSRGRSTGVYDVAVTRDDGKQVALFRGYAMEPRQQENSK